MFYIKQFSPLEKAIFTRHLSVMLKAGISLTESLSTLEEQLKSKKQKEIVKHIQKKVEKGSSLHDALAASHEFDQFYLSLVAAAERSGTLEKNLTFLSQHLIKTYNLKKKIQGALMYPALVFFATFGLGMAISLFVLPQLVDFFDAFGTDLPIATQILLSFSIFMKSYGVVFFIGLIALIIVGYLLLTRTKIKPTWHRFLLHVPVTGQIISSYEQMIICRNISILLESGVPIAEALEISSRTTNNEVFKSYLLTWQQSLLKGHSLSQMQQDKRMPEFSLLLKKMVTVGEKSGSLSDTLAYVSEFFEEEVDRLQKNMTTLLEPTLLLVIGIVIGFVALAIISPIYQLTGSLDQGA